MYQPTVDFENHYNCCKSDKKFNSEAQISNPEYKFAFNAYDSLVKALFVCYFDFETVLIPVDSSPGVKNACLRHEAIAVQYVIVDRDNNVKAYECLSGTIKFQKRCDSQFLIIRGVCIKSFVKSFAKRSV